MNVTKIATILSAAAVPFAVPAAGQVPGVPPPVAEPEVAIEADPEELIETFGFVVGLQSGLADLNLDEGELEAFLTGMRRAHAGEGIPENINEIIPQMQSYLTSRQAQVVERKAEENREKAQEFFADLEGQEGIEKTDEGLYYRIEEEGDGESPTQSDTVQIHYEGRLLDGSVFDSSRQRDEPAEFPLTGVIQGMAIGLAQLREGGKATLYIPPDLGYGDQSQPTIPPGSALIFEVELLDVSETPEPEFSPEMMPQQAPQQ